MAATVDALLPLSLLEAVRDIDTPAYDQDTEFVPELRNKRFGLSESVYAQIRRYTEAVRRNQRSTYDEVVAIARLIARRPDAEEVFRAAGRVLAEGCYVTVSPFTRRLLHRLPALLARPLALRRARRLARRYLNGTVTRTGDGLLLEVASPVAAGVADGADGAPHAAACACYETTLRELLRLLTGAARPIEHVRCAARGEGPSQWRAAWEAAAER